MQTEVYNSTNLGGPTNVSSIAKAALLTAQTQPILIQAKIDLQALVKTGKIKIQDNMHLLLGTVNRQFDNSGPGINGNPTQYYNFDTLQILATKIS